MSELNLLVDGILSGTGVTDAVNGGYVSPREIGLSDKLESWINLWLAAHEDAHFHHYDDQGKKAALDLEGLEITRAVRVELPNSRVGHFSNADMREIKL